MEKIRKIALPLSAAVMAIALFAAFAYGIPDTVANAGTIEFTGGETELRYDFDSELDIPAKIKVRLDGTDYMADFSEIVFPGGLSKGGLRHKLTEKGKYTLRYYFEAKGRRYKADKTFMVNDLLYTMTSPRPGSIKISDEEDDLSCNKTAANKKKGLIVNLTQGNRFLYNKPINLYEPEEDGLVRIISVDPRYSHWRGIDPKWVYANYDYDAKRCLIRLTDCYNEKNFITINMNIDYTILSTVTIGSTNVGTRLKENLEPDDESIIIDGTEYYVDRRQIYGASTEYNYGYSNNHTGIRYYFNPSDNGIYMQWNEEPLVLVSVIDNEALYGKDICRGFTTGEVYLSVYADGFYNSVARTEIISVGKDDGTVIAAADSGSECYAETVKPVITTEGGDEGFNAATGDTVMIPEAEVFDVNFDGAAETAVYTGYGTDAVRRVSSIGDRFIPETGAVYSIVYRAEDRFGNVGEKVINVRSFDLGGKKTLDISTDKITGMKAGEKITLPKWSFENLNDSKVFLSIRAKCGKETIDIDPENPVFMPLYEDTYEIIYSFHDNRFENTYSYSVPSVADENYLSFREKPVLPRFLIKGAVYTLEDINACRYSKGEPESVAAEAFMIFDGDGDHPVKADGLRRVKITGNTSAKVMYRAGDAVCESDEYPIADVDYEGRLNIAKYFACEGFRACYTDELTGREKSEIKYIAEGAGIHRLSFISPVSDRKFSLNYRINEGEDNFKKLVITLTGVKDSRKKAEIVIKNDALTGSSYIILNGGTALKTENFRFSGEFNDIRFDYSKDRIYIGKNYEMDMDLGGLCNLDISFEGVDGDAAIIISKLCGQPFSGTLHSDGKPPQINYEDRQGEYLVGAVVDFKVPYICDVLSPADISLVKFSVQDSGRNYVKDEKGIVLKKIRPDREFSVKFDKVGNYLVEYEVTDVKGNSNLVTYSIVVMEPNPPEIILRKVKDNTIRLKAGETYELDYTLKDDTTPEEKIVNHNYIMDALTDEYLDYRVEKTVTIKEAGTYILGIMAKDGFGNETVRRVRVIVS